MEGRDQGDLIGQDLGASKVGEKPSGLVHLPIFHSLRLLKQDLWWIFDWFQTTESLIYTFWVAVSEISDPQARQRLLSQIALLHQAAKSQKALIMELFAALDQIVSPPSPRSDMTFKSEEFWDNAKILLADSLVILNEQQSPELVERYNFFIKMLAPNARPFDPIPKPPPQQHPSPEPPPVTIHEAVPPVVTQIIFPVDDVSTFVLPFEVPQEGSKNQTGGRFKRVNKEVAQSALITEVILHQGTKSVPSTWDASNRKSLIINPSEVSYRLPQELIDSRADATGRRSSVSTLETGIPTSGIIQGSVATQASIVSQTSIIQTGPGVPLPLPNPQGSMDRSVLPLQASILTQPSINQPGTIVPLSIQPGVGIPPPQASILSPSSTVAPHSPMNFVPRRASQDQEIEGGEETPKPSEIRRHSDPGEYPGPHPSSETNKPQPTQPNLKRERPDDTSEPADTKRLKGSGGALEPSSHRLHSSTPHTPLPPFRETFNVDSISARGRISAMRPQLPIPAASSNFDFSVPPQRSTQPSIISVPRPDNKPPFQPPPPGATSSISPIQPVAVRPPPQHDTRDIRSRTFGLPEMTQSPEQRMQEVHLLRERMRLGLVQQPGTEHLKPPFFQRPPPLPPGSTQTPALSQVQTRSTAAVHATSPRFPGVPPLPTNKKTE